jgi:hypothetical protein
MSIPKLPFTHLPLKEKVTVTEDLVSDLTDHPDFPFPNPSLSVLLKAATELKTVAGEISSGNPVETAAVETKSKELERMIGILLSYVYKASGGDPGKYLKIRHLRESKKGKRRKRSFTIKQGSKPGDVILKGPPVRGGAILWQICPEPLHSENFDPETAAWQNLGEGTTSEYPMSGLESGTRVWFRMARVDKFGRGPFSIPASIIVP